MQHDKVAETDQVLLMTSFQMIKLDYGNCIADSITLLYIMVYCYTVRITMISMEQLVKS